MVDPTGTNLPAVGEYNKRSSSTQSDDAPKESRGPSWRP
jgi:hypothetical protein